jgi:hypothetical protein
MLDLEAIKKRHLDFERNPGRTYYEGHIEVDLAALVEEVSLLQQEARIQHAISDGRAAEVEHLRAQVAAAQAEAATMRAWAEEAAKAENENAEDARRERGAVVAWLKKQRIYCTDSTGEPNAVTATYAHAAEAVERGEHHREETE